MNNILITGASGDIGQYLIAYFYQKNYKVFVTLHNKKKFNNLHLTSGHINAVSSIEKMVTFLKRHKIEDVVHAANFFSAENNVSSLKKMISCQIIFSHKILVVAHSLKIKSFINLSSFWLCSKQNECLKQTNYAVTKMFLVNSISKLSKANEITKFINLYLPQIYVPFDTRKKLIHQLITNYKTNTKTVINNPEQKITYIHIHDLASILDIIIRNTNSNMLIEKFSNWSLFSGEEKNIVNFVKSIHLKLSLKKYKPLSFTINQSPKVKAQSKNVLSYCHCHNAYKFFKFKSLSEIEDDIVLELINSLNDT